MFHIRVGNSVRANFMGTFGPAMFSDDFACDVRDEFKEFIGEGLSPEQARHFILKHELLLSHIICKSQRHKMAIAHTHALIWS